MKAIILAAGNSTRTWPLTANTPKPLLKIVDKTLIEHNLLQLKGLVDEVIIVVGFKKQKIIDFLGNEYKGLKLTYVEQDEQHGTGHAVLICKKHIKENIIVMMGDDLFSGKDIKNLIKHKQGALAQETDIPESFGMFVCAYTNLYRFSSPFHFHQSKIL